MKKFFSRFNRKSAFGAFLIFLGVGYALAQTQFSEMNDIMFRSRNPQVRLSGVLSFRDLAGTVGGQVAHSRPAIVTSVTTKTLVASDCGAVIVSMLGSGTQVYTLPAVGNLGCSFTFITGSAAGEVQFKTPAVLTCVITHMPTTSSTAIVTDTSCEGGIKNTAASNVVADSITIVSDGTQWLGVGLATGIWAVV